MATEEAFKRAIEESTIPSAPHRKPHKAPQTVQDEESQDETGDGEELQDSAIDAGKDVIRLDLSCLGEGASMPFNCPTRT